MKERSLVRRALLGLILAEFVCLSLLAAISIAHEHAVRLRAIDISLQGRADSLFGAVQDLEDAGANIVLDPREMVLPEGDIFAVYDTTGQMLGASPQAPSELIQPRQPGVYSRRFHGHAYRVLERHNLRIIDRKESGGAGLERPVTIVYVTPLDRIWRDIFEAIGFYLAVSLLLIAGTTILMVELMRRLLQPLQDLALATAAVTPRELWFEAPRGAMEVRELKPLASTLSAVLNELKLAFERQHRFLGDAAHELKTAVTVVRSSLQLLLLKPRSVEEYAAGLLEIVRDNIRVEELISRMLLLARLEEQTSVRAPASDLGSVTLDCIERLRPLVEQARVQLRGDLFGVAATLGSEPEDTCVRKAAEDVSRCRYGGLIAADDLQVLVSNLLINAVEHSSAGSVVDLVLLAEGSTVSLRVTDRGDGISEEALTHLFERFYRADRSRARVTGGAGLGLSICKAIVDASGGTILITSKPGEGTTATATFPLLDDSVAAEPSGALNLRG